MNKDAEGRRKVERSESNWKCGLTCWHSRSPTFEARCLPEAISTASGLSTHRTRHGSFLHLSLPQQVVEGGVRWLVPEEEDGQHREVEEGDPG